MNGCDIDSIIGTPEKFSPYANSQPNHLTIFSRSIQRIPPLVSGGDINPEFQTFFGNVVQGVMEFIYEQDSNHLHQISDHTIEPESFHSIIYSRWATTCQEVVAAGVDASGIDIEVNMDRFKDIHRNLIGGFNVMMYHLNVSTDEFSNESDTQVTELIKLSTELLFTYKNGRFQIISRIHPFTKEAI